MILVARFKLLSAYREWTDGRSPVMLEALVTTLSNFLLVRLSELPFQKLNEDVIALSMARTINRAVKTVADPSHPANSLFNLPSGRQYRAIMSKTSRRLHSFSPQAIALLTNS